MPGRHYDYATEDKYIDAIECFGAAGGDCGEFCEGRYGTQGRELDECLNYCWPVQGETLECCDAAAD